MDLVKPTVQKAYLSVGSNLGDRLANLRQGISHLQEAGISVTKISSYFETEPIGFLDQPWFLNIALELETCLTPHQLLACCSRIEEQQGRVRSLLNGPRTLDLDILLYENFIIKDPLLVIPHPDMAERRFVLQPLAQIAPDQVHPTLKTTIRSMLDRCPDLSTVRCYSPGDPYLCIPISQ
jgi:2-amino-4-hydroxy-6-hydroxymethyldihydropteridine diphosphokinase